jgi:hypothetical protein
MFILFFTSLFFFFGKFVVSMFIFHDFMYMFMPFMSLEKTLFVFDVYVFMLKVC